MKVRIALMMGSLAMLMAACEDADNPGDDNLLTGGSLILVVLIVVVIVVAMRRRGR